MIDPLLLATVVGMAAATYFTRVVGFLLLRNRVLSRRATQVLEAVPGCVLISVIAPRFVASDPRELIAIGVTLLAAIRLPLLPTVLAGIAITALVRHF